MSGSNEVAGVVTEYAAKGYRVITAPGPADLPNFLQGLQPDIVAFGADEAVVIQVKHSSRLAHSDVLSRLAAALTGRPGWRLEYRSAGEESQPDDSAFSEALSDEAVEMLLDDAEAAMNRRHWVTAISLAAAGAEVLLRRIGHRLAKDVDRIGPVGLTKTLYSEGPLSSEQTRGVLELFELRNAAIHYAGAASETSGPLKQALETIRSIGETERIRSTIAARFLDETQRERIEAAVLEAMREYEPERRFDVDRSGGEINSESLDELDLLRLDLGEVQDTDASFADVSLTAELRLRFVFLIDQDYLSEVEDRYFEVQQLDAAEGLAMATTERVFAVEMTAWFDVTTDDPPSVEVASAEDITYVVPQ